MKTSWMTAGANKVIKETKNRSSYWKSTASSKKEKNVSAPSTRQNDTIAETTTHDWKLVGLAAVGGILGLIAAMW